MDPGDRIAAYFEACGTGTAEEIASHFTTDAVIYDTNVRPHCGAGEIATMWTRVRERWQGARWHVESLIAAEATAAIEWSMTGTDPATNRAFRFRGSEHYEFRDTRIAEIRQYWTFDPDRLDTGLIGYRYATEVLDGPETPPSAAR